MLIKNIFAIEIVVIENYSLVKSLAIRLVTALKNDGFPTSECPILLPSLPNKYFVILKLIFIYINATSICERTLSILFYNRFFKVNKRL